MIAEDDSISLCHSYIHGKRYATPEASVDYHTCVRTHAHSAVSSHICNILVLLPESKIAEDDVRHSAIPPFMIDIMLPIAPPLKLNNKGQHGYQWHIIKFP